MKKTGKILTWAAFALYSAAMAWLLFARSRGGIRGVNFVPFDTIKEFWTVVLQSFGSEGMEGLFAVSFINLAGNVVMFIPLGFFLPLLWKALRRWWLSLPGCAAVIIAVEALQFATARGSADIDDFILNMLGAALGYGAFAICRRMVGC